MKKYLFTIVTIASILSVNAQTFCLNSPSTSPFAVGTNPESVISADFNADGKVDMAVANIAVNSISILLGNGTSSFAPTTNFTVGLAPYSLTTADFNTDGKPDLATANASNNTISILLGNGVGGFAPAVNFAVGLAPNFIITSDFNADGKADLATSNVGGNNVSILLGNGAGSFAPAANFVVGTNPVAVISADFDADGKADLAAANRGNSTVSVLIGNGVGSFAPAVNFAVGTNPYAITSADFNADGKADLATSNVVGTNVSALIATGGGNFSAAVNFTVGNAPYSITSADFNSDGKADLATANYGSNNVSVLLGNGTGSFTVAVNFGVGISPYSITSTDFNSDGKADLATANYGSNNVSVLLNGPPFVTANASSTTVCAGTSITLTGGGATTYTWSGAVSNGVGFIPPTGSNTYTVTGTSTPGCTNTAIKIITVNALPTVSANATATIVCSGASITLTGVGASTYSWTGGVSNGIAFIPPTGITIYTVIGTNTVGCKNTATMTINVVSSPPIPDICMVSVDSVSQYNLISWEKTLYPSADSFVVYRETSTNIYKRIGAQHSSLYSQFTDTARSIGPANGNPNTTSYRYKLQIRDICGNYSSLSPYHNSIYFTSATPGSYSWNSYLIEGAGSTPVSTFDLFRDNNSTGSWTQVASCAGTQNTLNDASYASYPNANWRVYASGFICNPSFKTSQILQLNKSKSNIKNILNGGPTNLSIYLDFLNSFSIAPNPINNDLSIKFNDDLKVTINISVTDVLGKIIYKTDLTNTNKIQISLSDISSGLYFLELKQGNFQVVKKFVKE